MDEGGQLQCREQCYEQLLSRAPLPTPGACLQHRFPADPIRNSSNPRRQALSSIFSNRRMSTLSELGGRRREWTWSLSMASSKRFKQRLARGPSTSASLATERATPASGSTSNTVNDRGLRYLELGKDILMTTQRQHVFDTIPGPGKVRRREYQGVRSDESSRLSYGIYPT